MGSIGGQLGLFGRRKFLRVGSNEGRWGLVERRSLLRNDLRRGFESGNGRRRRAH